MLPFSDDNPVSRPPIVTWLIIAACLGIYLLWQPSPFSDTDDDLFFNLENASIPCEVVQGHPLNQDEILDTFGVEGPRDSESCDPDSPPPTEDNGVTHPDKNVWLALVTSMFLHGSLLHIGGNLLFLWVFGNNVEDAFGKVGFVAFYLVGGVVASLTHVVLNLDSTVPLVGASGAIAAVMGAYLVLFPRARVRTAIFFFLITVVALQARWVLGFWFVLQFFTGANSGVAWAAHVGGFVFGVLVGLAVRSLRRPEPAPATWPPSDGHPPGGFRPERGTYRQPWDDPGRRGWGG